MWTSLYDPAWHYTCEVSDSAINTLMYIEDVLLYYSMPCMSFVGTDSLFTQDNTYPLVVWWMLKFSEEVEIIARFEWPTCNLIDHIWDMLGRCSWAYTPPINSLNLLRTALPEEYEAIPEKENQALIACQVGYKLWFEQMEAICIFRINFWLIPLSSYKFWSVWYIYKISIFLHLGDFFICIQYVWMLS